MSSNRGRRGQMTSEEMLMEDVVDEVADVASLEEAESYEEEKHDDLVVNRSDVKRTYNRNGTLTGQENGKVHDDYIEDVERDESMDFQVEELPPEQPPKAKKADVPEASIVTDIEKNRKLKIILDKSESDRYETSSEHSSSAESEGKSAKRKPGRQSRPAKKKQRPSLPRGSSTESEEDESSTSKSDIKNKTKLSDADSNGEKSETQSLAEALVDGDDALDDGSKNIAEAEKKVDAHKASKKTVEQNCSSDEDKPLSLKREKSSELKTEDVNGEEAGDETEVVLQKGSEIQALADSLVDESEVAVKEEEEEQEDPALQEQFPVVYDLGEASWARVGSDAYWPCAMAIDPDSGVKYTRINKHVPRLGMVREYHVQFFGKFARAWVPEAHILKFEGVEKLKELAKKQARNKVYFVLKSHRKASWEAAVNELEETLEKSNEERLEVMKTKMQEAVVSTPGPKKRRRSCDSPSSMGSEPRSKKTKYHADEKLVDAIPEDILEENKRKLKTGFKLFQLANRAKVIKEAGKTKTESEIEKILSQMWNASDFGRRNFYKERSLSFLNNSKAGDNDDLESTISDVSSVASFSADTPTPPPSVTSRASSSRRSLPASSAASTSSVSSSSKKSLSNGSLVGGMIGVFKKEFCCLICEEVSRAPNDLVKCKGPSCQTAYHIDCMKSGTEIKSPENWKCEECETGVHSCMLCKETKGEVIKCNANGCGRYFHIDCLNQNGLWPQTRMSHKIITCPLHVCHTCASENPKDPFMKYNLKLVKCIRCPTAYHSGDYCVAAGTVQITATQIVCPKHFKPREQKKKNSGSNAHINTSWCFICSRGGSLICCEACPASFHVECLNLNSDSFSPDKYFCDHCETGRMPLYGEVVWVKLGNYRWWPAKVLHPSEVPANVEKLPHDVGEFPIQFCGSKEYYWMNRGRCFLYEEGDAEKIPGMSSSSGLDGAYRRGLHEAAEIFSKYTADREKREQANAHKVQKSNSHAKPPMFNKIKANKPFGDCPVYTADPYDKQICECNPTSEEPCGPDADCINRLLMQECKSSTCKAGDRCLNQRFQRRVYPPLKVLRTPTRGWGLYALSDVKKGDFLIEYVGELITMDEFRRRIQASLDRKEEQNYYYMAMDADRMLDAGPRGNVARFVNHSCDPNCETQKWTVNGDTRVGLFATEDIPANTELTFNYQFEAMGEQKKVCLCGAKNCSGFIGEKVTRKDKSSKNNDNLKKKAKVKEQPSKVKKVWEDLCFRCFDDGQVLMCDWKTCPKVYHLECLGREKMPREKWFCPWHHCVDCGKLAVSHCMHCPNAYCKSHNDVVRKHPELGMICDEHKDDIIDLVSFYRRVGGIGHLVPHPNVTPPEPTAIVRKHVPQPSPSEASGKENQAVAAPGFDANAKSQTQNGVPRSTITGGIFKKQVIKHNCKIEGCDFRSRRSKLAAHYMTVHEKSEDEAKLLMPKARPNELRKECPYCQLLIKPSNLRRHARSAHPDIDQKNRDMAIDSVLLGRTPVVTGISASKKAVKKSKIALGLIRNSKFFIDGRIKCKAPNCEIYISKGNMKRHWNRHHPDLDRMLYQPPTKRTSLGKAEEDVENIAEDLNTTPSKAEDVSLPSKEFSSSDKKKKKKSRSSEVAEATEAGDFKMRKCGHCIFACGSEKMMAEHRKETGHVGMRPRATSKKFAGKLAFESCGYKECNYLSKYKSNMLRHRRTYGHYLNEDEKEEAEEDHKRTEIAKAKEAEEVPYTTEEEESEPETDVRDLLNKTYSPTKITDYFRPLGGNVPKKKINFDKDKEEGKN